MRTTVTTDDAPAAIGPYSQAIKHAGILYCSGQIPLDPKTMALVGEGDVRTQAEQVMKNLGAVLTAGGSGWSRVLKTTIYLRDMDHFGVVNEVYGAAFGGVDPPARATVAVRTLPKNVDVEIDCVAACD